jgi:hypothetical protein
LHEEITQLPRSSYPICLLMVIALHLPKHQPRPAGAADLKKNAGAADD